MDDTFDDFVRARAGALFRYGFVLTGDTDDAADLVQEALLRLGDTWDRVIKKDDPEGYVRTIMVRQHISWWRRRRRERLMADTPDFGYTDRRLDGDAGLWAELEGLPADSAPCWSCATTRTFRTRRSRRSSASRPERSAVRSRVPSTSFAAGGSVVLCGGADGSTATKTKEVAPTATPAASARISERPAIKKPRPARVVWPRAVSTIPAKAGDGARYSPLAALSPTEVLLRAETKFEKTTRIDVYDTRRGKSRVLTQTPSSGKGYYPQRFELGEHYLGWFTTRPSARTEGSDFWVAPRAGGPATKVGEVTGALSTVVSIGVSADSFIWSIYSGGVYRIPITGGSPEKIAGTDGLWVASWPWAADLPPFGVGTDTDRNQTRLVNLETGEKHDIVPPPGVKGLRCSISWCVGRSRHDMIVMHPDGSGLSRIPRFGSFSIQLAGSHFVEVGATVYDLATGKTAAVGAEASGYGWGPLSASTALFAWEDGRGKLELLNLLAVDG
jgi:DNA-directed RNA polymerase specialized sigma24 family protein